jgi:hypothetical protein
MRKYAPSISSPTGMLNSYLFLPAIGAGAASSALSAEEAIANAKVVAKINVFFLILRHLNCSKKS